MELTLALLADAANVTTDGKLNVLGVFDTLYAETFPVVHPSLELVLQFKPGPAEYGQRRNIAVVLISDDGEEVGRISGHAVVPQPDQLGRRMNLQVIFPMRGLRFERAGEYAFHVLIDDDEKGDAPLRVLPLENREEDGERDAND